MFTRVNTTVFLWLVNMLCKDSSLHKAVVLTCCLSRVFRVDLVAILTPVCELRRLRTEAGMFMSLRRLRTSVSWAFLSLAPSVIIVVLVSVLAPQKCLHSQVALFLWCAAWCPSASSLQSWFGGNGAAGSHAAQAPVLWQDGCSELLAQSHCADIREMSVRLSLSFLELHFLSWFFCQVVLDCHSTGNPRAGIPACFWVSVGFVKWAPDCIHILSNCWALAIH